MKPSKLGIVFSGGGVRGCAHIGVIKALEELKITPEIIAGTSAGSVVGALYAQGYNSAEIFEFFSTTSLFSTKHLALSKFGILDANKFFNEFKDYLPHDSFEGLKKELHITATNIESGEMKVFSTGELIKPILASSAIPLVVTPIEIESQMYSDGGIVNNFPTQLIANKCDKLIGVYVNALGNMKKNDFKNGISVLKRAYHIGASVNARASFEDCSVLISPTQLSNFSTFDMSYAKNIFEIGYEQAMAKRKLIIELTA
jgi:NTE family protein